jgi:hypothetical protein
MSAPILCTPPINETPHVIHPTSEPLSEDLKWYDRYLTSLGEFTVDTLHELCCAEVLTGKLNGPFTTLYLEIVRQQDDARRTWWEKVQSRSS